MISPFLLNRPRQLHCRAEPSLRLNRVDLKATMEPDERYAGSSSPPFCRSCIIMMKMGRPEFDTVDVASSIRTGMLLHYTSFVRPVYL